jgi:hypothetical protein
MIAIVTAAVIGVESWGEIDSVEVDSIVVH